jgi:TfoX/Sxy family transcriptional regulator of competence genes
MAYDEAFAERVRGAIGPRPDVVEIKMFGGLCFTTHGNMFAGVMRDELLARVGPAANDEALKRPGARPAEIGSMPMKGYVQVASPGIDSDDDLQAWVDEAYAFASSLPPKVKKPKAPKARKY